jgi:hypothetical protein
MFLIFICFYSCSFSFLMHVPTLSPHSLFACMFSLTFSVMYTVRSFPSSLWFYLLCSHHRMWQLWCGRAVFVIGPDKRLKLSILYPATTGTHQPAHPTVNTLVMFRLLSQLEAIRFQSGLTGFRTAAAVGFFLPPLTCSRNTSAVFRPTAYGFSNTA